MSQIWVRMKDLGDHKEEIMNLLSSKINTTWNSKCINNRIQIFNNNTDNRMNNINKIIIMKKDKIKEWKIKKIMEIALQLVIQLKQTVIAKVILKQEINKDRTINFLNQI